MLPNGTTQDVYDQLTDDYADPAIAWVKRYAWDGPLNIPLSEIDFSDAKQWAASREPVAIAFHTIRISEGTKKPIILVMVDGEKRYRIADGHHRALAYRALDYAATAYTVRVPKTDHAWEAMHDAQDQKSLQSSQQSWKRQIEQQPNPQESGDPDDPVRKARDIIASAR